MQIKSLKSKYAVEFIDFSGNSKIPIANATNLAAVLRPHLKIVQYGNLRREFLHESRFEVTITGRKVFTTHDFSNIEHFFSKPQGKLKLILEDLCSTYGIPSAIKFLSLISYRKFLIVDQTRIFEANRYTDFTVSKQAREQVKKLSEMLKVCTDNVVMEINQEYRNG